MTNPNEHPTPHPMEAVSMPEFSYFGLTQNHCWVSVTKETYEELPESYRMAALLDKQALTDRIAAYELGRNAGLREVLPKCNCAVRKHYETTGEWIGEVPTADCPIHRQQP